jgi:crotonobetainyl-CoA:carnitine CoA-transferase CaiB-like acyl-CoA transferase
VRCRGNAARVANRDWLCAELAAAFTAATVASWVERFEQAGIPAAPINSVRTALESELTRARGLRIEIDGVPMLASPLRLARTPVDYRCGPPPLGAHGTEIAAQLGFDVEALRRDGALGGVPR